MFKQFFMTITLVFSALFMQSVDFAHASKIPQHLADLHNLLKNITPTSTGYTLENNQVTWPGDNGEPVATCFTDCSGLVNALFVHSLGFQPSSFMSWMGTERPFASHYFQMIAEENHFQQISHVNDILPGDVFVASYADTADSSDGTGYMAIIDKKPNYVHQMDPRVANTQQWTLGVIDCAAIGHGEKDSRTGSGLGRGMLRIYVDPSGHITGYTWNRVDGPFHSTDERPILIGRFSP